VSTLIETRAPARTTWTIDPSHTSVELSVKHMMFATAKGRFGDVKGTLVLDEEDVTRSSVEVEIDAASIDSRDAKRDGHLRSEDFLHVEQHPLVTFRSTRVEPAGGERLLVVGDLTIRGITREVTLQVEPAGRGTNPGGAEVIGFSASTQINRKDFGLSWNVALETGGWLVGDTVKVQIDLEAIRQA
jgi:polyisoprenoid-binding protein YceI